MGIFSQYSVGCSRQDEAGGKSSGMCRKVPSLKLFHSAEAEEQGGEQGLSAGLHITKQNPWCPLEYITS